QWQADLLPTAEFRQIWSEMKQQFERDQAARLIVEALYIAATYDQEPAVAEYLLQTLKTGEVTLAKLQQKFLPKLSAQLPSVKSQQHSLDSYDQLLSINHLPDTKDCGSDKTEIKSEQSTRRQPLSATTGTPQTAQAHPNAYPLSMLQRASPYSSNGLMHSSC
ncbi:MAG: hypothetical protein AAFY63_24505, partial [Cyanobacteria bacterium J06643_13]